MLAVDLLPVPDDDSLPPGSLLQRVAADGRLKPIGRRGPAMPTAVAIEDLDRMLWLTSGEVVDPRGGVRLGVVVGETAAHVLASKRNATVILSVAATSNLGAAVACAQRALEAAS